MSLVAKFEIHYNQFLDAEGNPTQTLPAFAQDPQTIIELYRYMALTRAFDAKAVALQRTGNLGTFPAALGQEAIGVGVGHAMQSNDIFIPYYRDVGTMLQRNVTAFELLSAWGGNELGNCFTNNKEDFAICVPIATQCLHAAGVAYAIKLRQQHRAVLVTLGDGATSEGDFYEAINVSGAWNLPIVFVVNNNQWAISVPRDKQTGAQTLAQKAIAAGIGCEQVDGNDVIAVRHATDQALQNARAGNGPYFIEALSYRLCDHTTADDATRYQDAQEIEIAWQNEPMRRTRNYLENMNAWDDNQEQQLQQQCKDEIAKAAEQYLNDPIPAPETMFDFLYESLPHSLQTQRDEVIAHARNP